jgi:uncharacterized protein YjbJ (UPF0337 family)
MDENRIEGTVRNVGGKVQEGVGRATGDTKSKAEGAMNQAAGTAQDVYGARRMAAQSDRNATLYDRYSRARNRLAARQDASTPVGACPENRQRPLFVNRLCALFSGACSPASSWFSQC